MDETERQQAAADIALLRTRLAELEGRSRAFYKEMGDGFRRVGTLLDAGLIEQAKQEARVLADEARRQLEELDAVMSTGTREDAKGSEVRGPG